MSAKDAFVMIVTKAIAAHFNVETLVAFPLHGGETHMRPMTVTSISATTDGYEVNLHGWGIAQVPPGTKFTITAP